ncbi:response regulator transcription factor [Brochothrix campestris]|uniref:Response regulator n=1 Tax=Brochothrix campestris FSL F6-1037 TaxID=1265861 RepID=W7CEB3_9LIST|nr:response regulator [Brochothrix campestris]EUJ37649.1 response regulator [Brochothrix campestris FSL F6-1037]
MLKVLLVDDEDIIREGLKMSVNWQKAGCVICGEASDGHSAVQQIEAIKPDIVLLDINMPLMSGLDVLKYFEGKAFVFLTIIISGYNDFNKAKQAIRYGVTDYLLKPLNHDELEDVLTRCKDRRTVQKQYELFNQKIQEVSHRELFVFNQTEKTTISSKSVQALLTLIEEHYAEKITVTDVAEQVNRSKTHLNKRFKALTGYTFNDYLNRYRIAQAIIRLEKGEDKISTIALDVGFNNYRYFIDIFKKYTHLLPSEFVQYSKTPR